jgi:hypothetical protein
MPKHGHSNLKSCTKFTRKINSKIEKYQPSKFALRLLYQTPNTISHAMISYTRFFKLILFLQIKIPKFQIDTLNGSCFL